MGRRQLPLRGGWLLVALGLLAFPAGRATAQVNIPASHWISIGPMNVGGRVQAIAVDPGDVDHWLIGAAGGGVWETRNGGGTWTPKTDGEASLVMGRIAFAPGNPRIVYAGTGEIPDFLGGVGNITYVGAGLLKSTDGSDTWTLLAESTFARAAFAGLKVHPANPDIVVAATTPGNLGRPYIPASPPPTGILKSTDGGVTWALKLPGPGTDLDVDPTNFDRQFAGLGRISRSDPASGVYRSLDGGETWSRIPGPWQATAQQIGRVAVAISPSNPDTVYVSIANHFNFASDPGGLLDLFRSDNAWAPTPTWTRIVPNPDDFGVCAEPMPSAGGGCNWATVIIVDPHDPDTLYGAGRRFVSRCSPCGAPHLWTPLVGISDGHAFAWAGRRLIVGSDGGVISGVIDGPSWVGAEHNDDLRITGLLAGSLHPTEALFALGGAVDAGAMQWTGLDVWRRLPPLYGTTSVISRASPETAWVIWGGNGSAPPRDGLLFGPNRTLDGGASFVLADTGLGSAHRDVIRGPLKACPASDDVLVSGTFTLYRTNDFFSADAPTWTANSPDMGSSIMGLGFAPSDPSCNTYAFGTASGQLRITTNGGRTWSDLNPHGAVPKRPVTDIAFDPIDPTTVYVTLSGFDEDTPGHPGHVFRATNALMLSPAWTDISPPANQPFNALAVNPLIPSLIYLGAHVGVWKSADGGASWTHFGPEHGLPNVIVSDLKFNAATSLLAAFTFGRGAFITQPLAPDSLTPVTVGKLGAGTVASTPSGIRCGDVCATQYENGTVVTLFATPRPGSTFAGWIGACNGTTPCTVTATGSVVAVTAAFVTATATTVTSSANPAVVGRPVTLTASVKPMAAGAGTPSGAVAVLEAGLLLGTAPLDATGHATFTADLAVGRHVITAHYIGDAGFGPSTSAALAQTIAKASTGTTLKSSASTIVHGQAVTFMATVSVIAPGAGTPTGSVTFLDGATALGTVPLDATGHASLTVATLAVGAHTVTARYGGDGSFLTSTSTLLTETVGRATSTTTLTSSLVSAVRGQPVDFTATVSVDTPGSGVPGGTVTFLDGTASLGTARLSPAGQATWTATGLGVGTHIVTARYAGDANVAGSASGTVRQTVAKAATTLTLAASATPAVTGEPLTFTATVTVQAPGAGLPMGAVTFLDGDTVLGTAPLMGGRAALATKVLALGDHRMTARYAGDASFAGSTSDVLAEPVGAASTTTLLTASPPGAVMGQPVRLVATVSAVPPGAGLPPGMVTFFDGPTALGTVTLGSARQAVLMTSSLGVGLHAITASYGGSAAFNASTSMAISQTISRAATQITMASFANPSVTGGLVTVTATVNVRAPGGGTPTGQVTFLDGATVLGVVPLNGERQATLTTTGLAVGRHMITVRYDGDGAFAGSTSAPLTETIGKAATATIVTTAGLRSAVYGEPVGFTATVGVVPPGAGTPTGTVALLDGAEVLSRVRLTDSGQATFTTAALLVGGHSIRARYEGDGSFGASTSAAVTETITKSATTIALTSSLASAVHGQPIDFTATVSAQPPGAGTPTGAVTFFAGARTLGVARLASGGRATLTTSAVVVGSNTIAARYSGDASFSGNTSAELTVDVVKASTTTVITTSVDPAVWHQPVTLTATVSAMAPGAGVPGGTVTFLDGATAVGSSTLNAVGQATLTTGALTVGDHPITASYNGDATFNGSVSTLIMETVTQAGSGTVLTASPAPAVQGRQLVLTATVGVRAPAAGTPTGDVTFFDGTTPLGTATLNNARQAMLITTGVPVGIHALTAEYLGDGNVAASTSSPRSIAVVPNLVGDSAVVLTLTTRGCTDPGLDTGGTGAVTLNVSNQDGAHFSGALSVTSVVSGLVIVLAFNFSGTVNASSAVVGGFTVSGTANGELVLGGGGTFSGTVGPPTDVSLSGTLSTVTSVTCQLSGSVTAM